MAMKLPKKPVSKGLAVGRNVKTTQQEAKAQLLAKMKAQSAARTASQTKKPQGK